MRDWDFGPRKRQGKIYVFILLILNRPRKASTVDVLGKDCDLTLRRKGEEVQNQCSILYIGFLFVLYLQLN